jgi:hypothetical protein
MTIERLAKPQHLIGGECFKAVFIDKTQWFRAC